MMMFERICGSKPVTSPPPSLLRLENLWRLFGDVEPKVAFTNKFLLKAPTQVIPGVAVVHHMIFVVHCRITVMLLCAPIPNCHSKSVSGCLSFSLNFHYSKVLSAVFKWSGAPPRPPPPWWCPQPPSQGGRRRICHGYYPDSLVVVDLLDACSYPLQFCMPLMFLFLKTSSTANFSW